MAVIIFSCYFAGTECALAGWCWELIDSSTYPQSTGEVCTGVQPGFLTVKCSHSLAEMRLVPYQPFSPHCLYREERQTHGWSHTAAEKNCQSWYIWTANNQEANLLKEHSARCHYGLKHSIQWQSAVMVPYSGLHDWQANWQGAELEESFKYWLSQCCRCCIQQT